ncbi:uncharacterized protein [Phaseolus vulgaris]|uniref:uncharacterized protein n=1 Tax=Phaseolus vulgaris TaxID=3885 RepID=UPI0035C99C9F
MPVHGEIHTISDGFLRGGCTASQRKRYTRSVMLVEVQVVDDVLDIDLAFTKADLRDVIPHDNDPVVISVVTAGRKVNRVLMDQGSSADVELRGYLELRTTFTDGFTSRIENIRYLVVNAHSAYNVLLGRPTLNKLRAVASTRHMKMKLSDLSGKVIVIKSDQQEAKRCYENSLKAKRGVFMVVERPLIKDDRAGVARAENARERKSEPVGNVVERPIGGKTFKLGKSLDQAEQDRVAEVIARHLDAFAWFASDMPRIDLDFLCHRLTMDPKVRPVRQRRRKFNEERRLVVQEETKKLLNAGHIREIQYPEWLANVVLVNKANGKWRMCADFSDLNKACPKDSYPLPSIDALVDNTSGCRMLSFLDAFSGYNQIKMHPRDECKTTFMTETSCYSYTVMSFGLKNAGATYQRMMDRADDRPVQIRIRWRGQGPPLLPMFEEKQPVRVC